MGNINTVARRIHKGKVSLTRRITTDYLDYENICCGNHFVATDNTANIGAETTPADTIEIYFTTPAEIVKEVHANFSGFCSTADAVFKIEEGYSAGGGASGDAASIYCLNRKIGTTSKITDMKIQADAITSGGTVLLSRTLTAGKRVGNEVGVGRNYFWILKPETKYAVSIKLDGAGVAWVAVDWHEI